MSLLLAARDEHGRALTDREVRDQLITMLLAGHETTASSLSWTFERLLRHPGAHARLREELDAGSSEYLDAVIKETLRCRPVGAHVARKLTTAIELGGYSLPAGTIVAISIYLLHHSPRLFEDPRSFRPERFLDGQPDSYAWIPFGGGVRRCPGSGLATLEMRTAIATILRLVELRAARPEPEAQAVLGVTLVPSRGGEVVVERRLERRDTVAGPVAA
jgi:cytochrome P450